MDALWVFDTDTQELHHRLACLPRDVPDSQTRRLVDIIQQELTDRQCHAELEQLLQSEVSLEEQVWWSPPEATGSLSPSRFSVSPCHVDLAQHPQAEFKLTAAHLSCPLQLVQHMGQSHLSEPSIALHGASSSFADHTSSAVHAMDAKLQQEQLQAELSNLQPGMQHHQQEQQQEHVPPLPQQSAPLLACAVEHLTPLQAAQRAFYEEQQRIRKARVALHKPVKVQGRAALLKQKQRSNATAVRLHQQPAGSGQHPCSTVQQQQQGCTQQHDKWHSQPDSRTCIRHQQQCSTAVNNPPNQDLPAFQQLVNNCAVCCSPSQGASMEHKQADCCVATAFKPGSSERAATTTDFLNGTSTSASRDAAGIESLPDVDPAEPDVDEGLSRLAIVAGCSQAEAGLAVSSVVDSTALAACPMKHAGLLDGRGTACAHCDDAVLVQVLQYSQHQEEPEPLECRQSSNRSFQQECTSQLVLSQEVQQLHNMPLSYEDAEQPIVHMQQMACSTASLSTSQADQDLTVSSYAGLQEQLYGPDVFAGLPKVAAMGSNLGSSCPPMQAAVALQPGLSLMSSSVKQSAPQQLVQELSVYPQAVFNQFTGRAGVHQPLGLDSWKDWDAMAGSMDESCDGFGAWRGAHD